MALESYLKTKDYSVSKENFELLLDDRIDLLITNPRPEKEDLGSYYESENYISHTDSKKTITEIAYNFVKKYALNKKLELLNSFSTEHKTVLDIGCGTGDFLNTCQQAGWKVTGIEPSKKAREKGLEKLKKGTYIYSDIHAFFEDDFAGEEKEIDYKQSYKHTKLYHHSEHETKNVEKEVLKFEGKEIQNESNPYQFDVITLWHVLEHVYDLDMYIYRLKQLLKPDGVLVIAVPNYKSYDAEHYKQFWAAYDVPRHLWHFSQTSIHRLFSTELMKVVKTIPMKFDAFYVSLLSEQYKTGKKNFIKAIINGIKSNKAAKRTGEYSSLIYVLKNMKNE
ncbi:bifunctional 2-polyprenyl-6-hydroxyphenol methylase/3-demethylubiquinol 3-O-methyltransferase UbiG [Wenyingzhuangia sp. 2_MG-2023]|uniref:class I SAM-dependent methyltransferase n=1 Tax=Wenyingzhuangia sp. 2_MG-2023 TaxID=3062639 RepID=UPI0026E1B835|nr:class I SAM-dependent methyltransferase [Wenyingzhuangia sp. 2_MG-2023]MDO6736684.1 class I SAM-dependent methyltransferase [Wenyingzhuangia sp. 2_MG-2023]